MVRIPHRAVWSLIVAVLILSSIVVAPTTTAVGVSVGIPQNVRITGTIEGIDVRWDPPAVGEPTNYRVAYKAVERPSLSRNWSFSYSEGNTIHLIRHLAGGYEFNVFVQACEANCDGKWANGGTVFTKSPSTRIPQAASTPTPNPTVIPTRTPRSTPTPTPTPTRIAEIPIIREHSTGEDWIRLTWSAPYQRRHVQIGYRKSTDEVWSFIDTRWKLNYTIYGLQAATEYVIAVRGYDATAHGVPWSNVVELTTLTPPTPTPIPTCVLREGETGHEDGRYDYLGGGDWHPRVGNNYIPSVTFTNPDWDWEYGILIRWSGTLRVTMTVNSDGTWQIKFGEYSAARVRESGKVAASGKLDVNSGYRADNSLSFGIFPEVVKGFRNVNAYTGKYEAAFRVNGVGTEDIALSDELSRELYHTGSGTNYWVDAYSVRSRVKYRQIGYGRQCHDSS